MQNAGLVSLGLNWRYLAFDVYPEHLKEAIEGAKRMRFIGLNLTVPHKLLAVEMVDALDESARTWGAVNTIRFEGRETNGSWKPLREWSEPPLEVRACGFNTDAAAIIQALREDLGLDLEDKKVVVLGAGGAGRTAALKLASQKVSELFLINRTRSKAEAVASEIQRNWPAVKVSLNYPAEPVELVLNATSLGLKETDALPFDQARFSLDRTATVYDMIYRPAETPLLKSARAAGARVANGLSMLLYQGAKALELWTGQSPPLEAMRQALQRNVYGT